MSSEPLDPRDAFRPSSPLWGAMVAERPMVIMGSSGMSIERTYRHLRHAAVCLCSEILAELDDHAPALDEIRYAHCHQMQIVVRQLGEVLDELKEGGERHGA